MIFKYPNPQEVKKTKDCFLIMRKGTNKGITILIPKAPSNHALGQDALLVATPQVKSVNSPEGARLGLNSLTFSQGGLDRLLWAPTINEMS